VGDGEFGPGLVDGGVEEAEFEVGLYGDVLGEAVGGVAGRRLDEDILAVEAEAFVCDFGGGDFEGPETLDGVYEELLWLVLCQLGCVAELRGRIMTRLRVMAGKVVRQTHTLDLHGHDRIAQAMQFDVYGMG
jgi:hypothetical protein